MNPIMTNHLPIASTGKWIIERQRGQDIGALLAGYLFSFSCLPLLILSGGRLKYMKYRNCIFPCPEKEEIIFLTIGIYLHDSQCLLIGFKVRQADLSAC